MKIKLALAAMIFASSSAFAMTEVAAKNINKAVVALARAHMAEEGLLQSSKMGKSSTEVVIADEETAYIKVTTQTTFKEDPNFKATTSSFFTVKFNSVGYTTITSSAPSYAFKD